MNSGPAITATPRPAGNPPPATPGTDSHLDASRLPVTQVAAAADLHPRTDPPRRFRHAYILPFGGYLTAAGTVDQARMVADDAGTAGLLHCYVLLTAGAAVKAIGHARDRRRPPPGVVAPPARPSDEQARA